MDLEMKPITEIDLYIYLLTKTFIISRGASISIVYSIQSILHLHQCYDGFLMFFCKMIIAVIIILCSVLICSYAALSDDEDDEDWNSGSKKNKIIKKFEPKKKKEGAKRSNKLINKDFKPGNKNDCRSKEECVDWLTSTKMQLSPISSVRLKKSVPDLDTEAEDTSTTPSPADSNSTSSGSASRRKDRVKSKRKLTKNSRFSEESDSLILR
uniref:Uncharacterized protein n=1 Tax=Rhodnius prolixus TaxID=13249 RepID=A0A905QWC0_RHOPR